MDEDKTPSPEEATAFNNGYLLSQFEPELLQSLLTSINGENSSLDALKAGMERYNSDRFDDLTMPWPHKTSRIVLTFLLINLLKKTWTM